MFTLNVIDTVGSSISTKSIFSGLFTSQIVSPMFISEIPDRQTISPAETLSTSVLFNPTYVNNFAILPCSVLSFLQTATVVPLFIVPLSTLPTAILPKYSS